MWVSPEADSLPLYPAGWPAERDPRAAAGSEPGAAGTDPVAAAASAASAAFAAAARLVVVAAVAVGISDLGQNSACGDPAFVGGDAAAAVAAAAVAVVADAGADVGAAAAAAALGNWADPSIQAAKEDKDIER